MSCFFLRAIFLIPQISLLAGIVIKRNSGLSLLSTVSTHRYPPVNNSNVDVKNVAQVNPFVWNDFNNKQFKNTIRNTDTKKISTRPTVPSLKRESSNISKSWMRRVQVAPWVAKGLKPIYETDSESEVEASINDQQSSGYFYEPPANFDGIKAGEEGERETRDPYDELTSALFTLDRLFQSLQTVEGYNSGLHPPVNPLLALILSKYGKYVRDGSTSSLYSYMTVNNIHNHRPFGQYKYDRDESFIYTK